MSIVSCNEIDLRIKRSKEGKGQLRKSDVEWKKEKEKEGRNNYSLPSSGLPLLSSFTPSRELSPDLIGRRPCMIESTSLEIAVYVLLKFCAIALRFFHIV